MSATTDDIARRLAERIAPMTHASLPSRVEQVLVDGEEMAMSRIIEPAIVLGLASFIVSLSGLTWNIFTTERARLEQHAAAARAAGQEAKNDAVLVEVAYLKGLVLGQLGAHPEVEVPRALPEKLRIAVVEAAAEEAVAAGNRERAL